MGLKLFYSPSSPYVRKVLVCAHEMGIADRIERLACNLSPVLRDEGVAAVNPLSKIPTLFTENGTVLFDSPVICEYLDTTHRGGLIPPPSEARWRALRDQALADGLLDASVSARHETATRPPEHHWPRWRSAQLAKVTGSLDLIDKEATGYATRVDIGTIAVGCALGYLDFRLPDLAWREGRPNVAAWFARFGERASMKATRPPGT